MGYRQYHLWDVLAKTRNATVLVMGNASGFSRAVARHRVAIPPREAACGLGLSYDYLTIPRNSGVAQGKLGTGVALGPYAALTSSQKVGNRDVALTSCVTLTIQLFM